jgi:transcriptional regulator
MYLPKHFEAADPAALHALMRAHPLATWVMLAGGELVANHVPFLFDADRGPHGTLVGHVARANPAWRAIGPSVVVFQAADGYISPSWYPGKAVDGRVVPTWNYSVVHAHGTPRVVDDPAALLAIVGRLTRANEAGRAAPWAVSDAPADFIDKMLGAIVGIEIPVQRLVGKAKLSQNRPPADRAAVVGGLRQEAAAGAHALADLMEAAR